MGSFVEKTGHVYWIHLPEHKNIKSDGYIGITNSTVAIGKENMELKLTCTANENNRAKTTHGLYAKYINQNKAA